MGGLVMLSPKIQSSRSHAVIAHVRVEIPQEDFGIPGQNTIQQHPKDCKMAGYSQLLTGAVRTRSLTWKCSDATHLSTEENPNTEAGSQGAIKIPHLSSASPYQLFQHSRESNPSQGFR